MSLLAIQTLSEAHKRSSPPQTWVNFFVHTIKSTYSLLPIPCNVTLLSLKSQRPSRSMSICNWFGKLLPSIDTYQDLLAQLEKRSERQQQDGGKRRENAERDMQLSDELPLGSVPWGPSTPVSGNGQMQRDAWKGSRRQVGEKASSWLQAARSWLMPYKGQWESLYSSNEVYSLNNNNKKIPLLELDIFHTLLVLHLFPMLCNSFFLLKAELCGDLCKMSRKGCFYFSLALQRDLPPCSRQMPSCTRL